MPSSYTTSGIELIGDGEQSGSWGDTTNTNLEIIDRLTSRAGSITLAGTTHTLSLSDGTLSDGQYAVLVFGGAPSGTNTVTISPNDAQRVFIVKNDSGESVVLTQGSGGNVTVADGKTAIVYCDGQGSGAAVVSVSEDFVSATLAAIGALTPTDGNFIVGNGTTWVAESGNTVLASIGVTATTTELNVMDGITATTSDLNTASTHYVPSGGIIMWSGAVSAVPSGWYLCDGTNGTPNLTGRFVVHADADSGGTYAPGDTGGADSVTLTSDQIPAHTHSFSATTSSEGAHDHTTHAQGGFNLDGTPRFLNNGNNGLSGGDGGAQFGFGTSPDTDFRTSEDGAHTHTVSGTTGSTGGGNSHENRPPYYALAYIMKA